MFKNVASQKVAIYAWDGANGEAKTGDSANITAQISIDAGVSAATNDVNPTELDAADHPGIYIFNLTQAETNGDLIIITPMSSTSNIVIRPIITYTTVNTTIDSTYDLQEALKIILAFVSGKANGASGTDGDTINFRDAGDTKNVLSMTVDAFGNRTSVTLNP